MWCSDLPLLLVNYMFRDVVLNLYVKQIFRNEITEKVCFHEDVGILIFHIQMNMKKVM